MAEKEGLLPFKLIEDESAEALTSYSGVPLVVETCEALGLARLVEQHVRIKQRQRGVVAAQKRGQAFGGGIQRVLCALGACPPPGRRVLAR